MMRYRVTFNGAYTDFYSGPIRSLIDLEQELFYWNPLCHTTEIVHRPRRINDVLLRMVADYVEAHPDEFDMTCFIGRLGCGTTACVAGTAVLLALPQARPLWLLGSAVFDEATFVEIGGREVSVHDIAQSVLGLSNFQANDLFMPDGDFWQGVNFCSPRVVAARLRQLADGEVSL